jgi:hypothetical protein
MNSRIDALCSAASGAESEIAVPQNVTRCSPISRRVQSFKYECRNCSKRIENGGDADTFLDFDSRVFCQLSCSQAFLERSVLGGIRRPRPKTIYARTKSHVLSYAIAGHSACISTRLTSEDGLHYITAATSSPGDGTPLQTLARFMLQSGGTATRKDAHEAIARVMKMSGSQAVLGIDARTPDISISAGIKRPRASSAASSCTVQINLRQHQAASLHLPAPASPEDSTKAKQAELPAGLVNLGNTCFFSSLFQSLAYLPDFARFFCLHKSECTLVELHLFSVYAMLS